MERIRQILRDHFEIVVVLHVDGTFERRGSLSLCIFDEESAAGVLDIGVDQPSLSLKELAI